ncbi:MAG: porin family protein [Gemmatimonadales bacterium]|nr:porin family protein [Gemmatimonadales bacterium]
MKKSFWLILSAFILMIGVLPAQALDGDRKGIVLNLGAGMGLADVSASDGTSLGLAGDFKIGSGLNSQILIYFTNRTLFFSQNDSGLTSGLSAVGASYFLKSEAPSFFVSGAFGEGRLIDSNVSGSKSGLGYTAGLGFEFASNWIVEATYMNAKVDSGLDADWTISNLVLSFSWLAY